MESSKDEFNKWFWMMNYCKEEGVPPAQAWAWRRAERQYNKTNCS